MKKTKFNKKKYITEDPKMIVEFWSDSTHPIYTMENSKWVVVVKGKKNDNNE